MCRIEDLRAKEVINICDGARLGYVYDVEVDICTGHLVSIIVPGPGGFCGIFGRRDEYVIPWCEIQKIGENVILVNIDLSKCLPPPRHCKRKF
ncbi:MAG: YlmC/YmxH family sporulation protein [Bacillota bacterium]|nr:YlmC/YmxH family sporulation protein [Bacillota bacterium]